MPPDRVLTWPALAVLIVVCWAVVGAVIPLDRWLNRRAVVRAAEHITHSAAERLLHRLAEAAQDDQEPTP